MAKIEKKEEVKPAENIAAENKPKQTSKSYAGIACLIVLLCCAGRLVLLTEEAELLALSPTGERLYTAALPDSQSYPVAAGSGHVYAVQETGGGNLLYQIDGESGELTPAFSCDEGEIFNGSGGAFLLLSAEDGLYALEEDGGSRPGNFAPASPAPAPRNASPASSDFTEVDDDELPF